VNLNKNLEFYKMLLMCYCRLDF